MTVRFWIAAIAGIALAVLLFPTLRDRAIEQSLSVRVVSVTGEGRSIRVVHELSYDTTKARWLAWFAPESILVDRGLLSSWSHSGQRMEWLTPDGRIEPTDDWSFEDGKVPGNDIATIRSGETIRASFYVTPDDSKEWQTTCRVVLRVFQWRKCQPFSLSRPRFTKSIAGERYEPVRIYKMSPWFEATLLKNAQPRNASK